jgi:hypothetical protein
VAIPIWTGGSLNNVDENKGFRFCLLATDTFGIISHSGILFLVFPLSVYSGDKGDVTIVPMEQ